jgi:DNA-directed RNA polymerase subunit RPC12/RpoP
MSATILKNFDIICKKCNSRALDLDDSTRYYGADGDVQIVCTNCGNREVITEN